MSWNGSEQLEKAMEEVLDDDDDDESKVEKSSVEKMEKHSNPATQAPEPLPAGIDAVLIYSLPSGWSVCYLLFPSYSHSSRQKYLVQRRRLFKACLTMSLAVCHWRSSKFSWCITPSVWTHQRRWQCAYTGQPQVEDEVKETDHDYSTIWFLVFMWMGPPALMPWRACAWSAGDLGGFYFFFRCNPHECQDLGFSQQNIACSWVGQCYPFQHVVPFQWITFWDVESQHMD